MAAGIQVEKKKLKTPPLEIHTLGDRVLRRSAKRVSKIDAELRRLAEDMLKTMYSNDGVGLAAPQVGLDKQLLVLDTDPTEASNAPMILVNPVIKRASRETALDQEGCLSIPGVFLDVTRPAAIEVSYRDEFGRPQLLRATDFLARVIQHEMDHLNGVMFVDRVDNQLALTEALRKEGFDYNDVRHIPSDPASGVS